MVSSIRSYLAEEIGPLDTCQWVRKADCDAEIARLTAERDEAKAVAVWAANRELRVIGPIESGKTYLVGVGVRELVDGTDDSLYRALVEACEGGRDHG